MWQIFLGTLALSIIHVAIPNHWIPLVAIGKAEKWTFKETLSATIITGFAHTLSTILIGIVVGLIGIKLSTSYSLVMRYVAPSVLILLGLIYLILDFKNSGHHHHHHHADYEDGAHRAGRNSRIGIIFSLSIAMFLTPCAEIEAYYFQAGLIGWPGIFIVSAVYTLTTVTVMIFLVYAGIKGAKSLRSHTLEHHEKLITGIVLVGLGILAAIVEF